jgi:hypothetical protein
MSTGTAVATTERRSVIREMAHRYGMEPDTFENTVRATCMPQGRDVAPMTREEFAAGIMVAENYGLNPILREIYFYPKQGGGIVPVVSIDGWLSLINRRKELDGIEFDELHDDHGKLVSITCRIYRRDRQHPTIVTEHLSECIRDTKPWKMQHRMLRHKALIQCARYAFGFAGIHDEDEAERIVDATAQVIAGPSAPPPPPAIESRPQEPAPPANANTGPAAPPAETVEEAEIVEAPAGHNFPQEEHELLTKAGAFDETKLRPIPSTGVVGVDMAESDQPQHPPLAQEDPFDPEAWLEEAKGHFDTAKTASDVDDVHEMFGDTANELGMVDRQKYQDMHEAAVARVQVQPGPEQAEVTGEPGPAPEEAQGDEDDDTIQTGPAAPPQKTEGDLYIERIRAAINAPGRTYKAVGDLWNATKPERLALIQDGEITKAQSKELFRAIMGLDGQDQAAAPAGPGQAELPVEEDEATAYDRSFRFRVQGCNTLEAISALSAGTLAERAKFAGNPLQTEWKNLVADRRKAINGLS